MTPLVFAAGAALGWIASALAKPRAAAPTFAVQPQTWNIRYTKTGPLGPDVSAAHVVAERVPGFGNQVEEWPSNLVWESPDGYYGVVYGGAPEVPELQGFLYARPSNHPAVSGLG